MKKLVISLLTALTLACFILAVGFNLSAVNASTQIENQYIDEFAGKEFSEDWENHGAQLNTEYYALSMVDFALWGPSINLVNHKVTGGSKITFDVNYISGQWIGLSFGLQSANTKFMFGNSAVIFTHVGNSKKTSLMTRSGAQLSASTMAVNGEHASAFTANNVFTTIVIAFGTDGSIEISSGVKGGAISPVCKFTEGFAEGYIGFGGMGPTSADITYFKLENASGVIYEDDFKTSSLGYPTTGSLEKDWYVSSTYGEANAKIGAVNSVKVTENSLLSYKPLIKENGKSETVFRATLDIKKLNLTEGAFFGVGFGRTENSSAVNEGSFIGFGRTSGNYYLASLKGDKVTEVKKNFSLKTFDNNNETKTITVTGYFGGEASVAFGGEEFTFSGLNLNGYIAIGCFAAENKTALAWFDNFSIDTVIYHDLLSDDISNDFKGVKEFTEDGFEYKEKYLNKYEYFLGSGVSVPKFSEDVNRDYIQFINCNQYSVLVPKYQYGDFILRFDFAVTRKYAENKDDDKVTPLNARFGFAMGMKSVYYTPTESSFFAFQNAEVPVDDVPTKLTKVVGKNMTDDTGKTSEYGDCEYNIWKKANEWYNFMAVVENGKVSVYYKRADEPESKMEILRHTYYSENTSGYVGIFGVDGAYFQMTNLSITNLNPNKVSGASGFTKNGSVTENNGTLSLAAGSSLTTESAFNNFIALAKIKTDENATLKLSFGGNEFSINRAGEITNSANIKIISSSFKYNMLKNGAKLRFSVTGNSFTLGVQNVGSEAQLYSPVIVGEFINKTADQAFSITVENGSAEMGGVSAFTLNSSIPCKTYNYDEGYEKTFVKKVVKPDINESSGGGDEAPSGSGCKSSANMKKLGAVSAVGVFSAIIFLFVRRKSW